ncbi:Cryptochrome/photolyase FAD-binding domain-containing protein [Microthyrium microscopicum]|uniref:Cryptochrome/photolyase FAD-binding domain-containing protein n=1 Tax=Microthyrium microscopicum TaxID=703497 RepID=A0A6A6UHA4_9PEZI|nr:Cryptochrome/photolyase FAD-binding domain-containing protein [Microthyrium microscopicum]
MTVKPRVLYWFRTDLRLHDSPGLKAALDLYPEVLYPIWTWDPQYVYNTRVGPNRWQFLIDCQNDLSTNITKLNSKSKLFVLREAPQTVLPKLFKAWRITHLVFEKDTDAYARDRDHEVTNLAKKAGITIICRQGRNLYDPDELVDINGGPTMTIAQVQSAAKKLPAVPRPLPAPLSLPDPGDTSFEIDHSLPEPLLDRNAGYRNSKDSSYMSIAGPNGDFAVPTLKELGITPATTPHRGGESIALKNLADLISDPNYIATFSKPESAPTAFSPQSTTLLSPHLHFGSLSIRKFYWDTEDTIVSFSKRHKGKATVPPTNLTGQLLFRDMYFGAQASLGHKFGRMLDNPKCRFIPWHLPSIYDDKTAYPTKYSIDSVEADIWFKRWQSGTTGFPWIDGLMRQLRTEGWIHHLGRHAVACFLTRGGCYIDWERGAEVFEMWLLDHEVACNAGNWQWLSATAFFSQYFRIYSPITFPAKWDKNGDFVRKYVPELGKYPAKYIYEPWKAPIADQKSWGCVIKGDGLDSDVNGLDIKVYPKPMFDFSERRKICLDAMKKAYSVHIFGDNPEVKDGSWQELFDNEGEGVTKGPVGPGAAVHGSAVGSFTGEITGGDATSISELRPPEDLKLTAGRKRVGGQMKLDGMIQKKRRL